MPDEEEKPKNLGVKTKRVSLRIFIEENYRLFTVMGVVGGLTALFTRLENAEYLAFISFIMFILLDFELWIAFPKSEEASLNMKIFELLLQVLLVAVGVYLIQAYKAIVVALLPGFFTILFGGIFLKLFQKFELFKPIRKISPPFKRRSAIIRGLIGFSIVIGMMLLATIMGSLVADLIKRYFGV